MRKLEYFVIAAAVALMCLFYLASRANQRDIAEGEFRRITDEAVDTVQTRIDVYTQGLTGTAADLLASRNLDAKAFETYVESLDIAQTLPGMSGIGLISRVADGEIDAFVAQVRSNRQPTHILNKLTDCDQHYLVQHLYPAARNQQALDPDVTF